ncbi:MAG: Imidazolonepropionase [Acidobacteriaceae bacterium]|nr:Imidazolonepropionase [Acidobacteriaceae bacterium]
MRSLSRGISQFVVALAMLSVSLSAQAPKKIAMVGGMLITGLEEPPIHHATVLIEGNRIVAIGPMDQIKIPADATVVDTSGQTMLPGLIDTHVHMVLIGHGDYPRYFKWLDEHQKDYPLSRIMDISAKQLLMAGVTSVVDLGAPLQESLDLKERIKKGMPGPRIQISGPWLTRHVAIFPDRYQINVTSPEQAAAEVDRLAAAGVDVIKAHAGLTREDYFAIVAAAHKHKIKVHAHIYDEEAVRNAFDSGVDVLQHVGSAGTPPFSQKLMDDIVASGRPVVPTAAHRVWVYPATVDFPERLDDPQYKEDLGEPLYSEMKSSFKNFTGLGYFTTMDRQMFFGDKSLEQWITSGAVVSMGTDNGTPMNFHKDALWRELKVFVDHGMTPQRAIIDATRINARNVMGIRDLGTVEVGKLADVIAVEGNPLFDIAALGQVKVVVKDGVIYKGGPETKKK